MNPAARLGVTASARVRRSGDALRVTGTTSVVHLSEVASEMFRLVDGRRTALEVAACLAAEYDVSPGEVLADIIPVLDELIASGAVVATPP